MFNGIHESNSTQSSLQSNLTAAAEKATSTKKTQLIFVRNAPTCIGNRIINERCIFFHPDGRITCVENPESALSYLTVFNGEIYLPEHIAADEILLDLEA